MTEWISVKDRLPGNLDEDDMKLVFAPNGGLSFAFRMGKGRVMQEGWYRLNYSGYAVKMEGVTHWMDLPEDPE